MANEKFAANMKANPMEICSIVHKNQTLAVQNGLTEAGSGEDANQPTKLYSAFSRFPACVIQDHKPAVANIAVEEVPAITARSEFCFHKEMELSLAPAAATSTQEGQKSSAYTLVLSAGRGMKGKTAAQFLLETGDDAEAGKNAVDALGEQWKWLNLNVKKNPGSKYAAGNKAQMDAIADAVTLYKKGELSSAQAGGTGGNAVAVFESGFRPLIRRKRDDGKCFVYEYSISWTFGNTYPVAFEIRNYYAPVVQTAQGTLNVTVSGKDRASEVVHKITMTAKEWQWVLYMMRTSMRIFENGIGYSAYKRARSQDIRNKEEAKAAKEAGQGRMVSGREAQPDEPCIPFGNPGDA